MLDARTDVIVAGAGPAGATIARLLAARGKKVVLVDAGACRSARLEVIPPVAGGVIAAVGLTGVLEDRAIARPCLGIRRRWGTAMTEIDDFLAHPGGRGFVVERSRFDGVMRDSARAAGVQFVHGRVVSAKAAPDRIELTIDSRSGQLSIAARMAVDATGRPALLARRMGARRVLHERLIAEQRRTDQSPVPDHERAWLEVDGYEHEWSYHLAGPSGRRESWVVARAETRRKSRIFPRVDASSACLSPCAGNRWIAIGDAAASFDPITSQGLVNALATALVGAGAIISPQGVNEISGQVYSDAVAATFQHSETARAAVYATLRHRGTIKTAPAPWPGRPDRRTPSQGRCDTP